MVGGNHPYGCLSRRAKPGTDSLVAEVVQAILLEALHGPGLCAYVVAGGIRGVKCGVECVHLIAIAQKEA